MGASSAAITIDGKVVAAVAEVFDLVIFDRVLYCLDRARIRNILNIIRPKIKFDLN